MIVKPTLLYIKISQVLKFLKFQKLSNKQRKFVNLDFRKFHKQDLMEFPDP